ncbi:hypothetical protein D3C78_1264850 [compost metagenome]
MEMNQEEFVTIPKALYEELLDRDFKLSCLDRGGVSDWQWYEESLQDGGYWNDEDD